MKARIKETEEIIEKLQEFLATHHENVECDICLNVFEDLRNLFEEISERKEIIDWEQRRYEIAKDAMGAFIASPDYQLWVDNNYYESQHTAPNFVAEEAVKYADALIEELKGGEK